MLIHFARRFYLALFSLLLCFAGVEVYCAYNNSVGLDEFHNIYLARKVIELVPYRDWQPFKTTLSLYFHSLPFYFFSEQWQIIHFLKIANIFLISSTLAVVCRYLSRTYNNRAVFLSLLLLVCNSTFLAGALEIRPDILNSITGLIAFCLILEKRAILAGIFVALSFCLSQKGIFYFASTNIALFAMCLNSNTKSNLYEFLKFNICCVLAFSFYLIHACIYSSLSGVLVNIFLKHLYLLNERNYPNVKAYWLQTIFENPLFLFVFIAACCFTIRNWRQESEKSRFVFVYACSLLICCYLYPEPLPYFYILLLPTIFIFNTIVIDKYLMPAFANLKLKVIRFLIQLFSVSLGVVFPVVMYVGTWQSGQAYQQVMTIIGGHLLQKDETYFAGTSFLTFKEQSHPELVWLDMRKLSQLEQSTQEQKDKVLQQLKENPPKFIYSNYKIDSLPQNIVEYFEKNYFHYFGNIYIYSVGVEPGMNSLEPKYSGDYILMADEPIEIDKGKLLNPNTVVRLSKGQYPLRLGQAFRLLYKPKLELDSRFDRYRNPRD